MFQSNFPERNRLMAAISDATVIVEASDTSGSLHQAAECVRLGRWLFTEDPSLRWPIPSGKIHLLRASDCCFAERFFEGDGVTALLFRKRCDESQRMSNDHDKPYLVLDKPVEVEQKVECSNN